MAKNLVNKLVNKVRKATLVAAAVASLGFASCKFCAPGPTPVNYPPEITSIPAVTEINEGNSYNYDVNAIDIDGDKLTYSLPLFPPWLSIDSNTGLISGTAPQVDSDTPFDIEVGVSDNVNPVVKQSYTLTVKNVVGPINHPPEITSTPITQIDEGSSYNYDVDATDIDEDSLEYSLGIAPSWLSINPSTGLISGTAPQVDADTGFDVEVGVSDNINPTVNQDYILTVKNGVPPIDYLDVEGYLQDNETDTGKQGTIKIYDSAKQFIGETTSDSNGHFTFHSDTKKATDLSQIIIQAQATSGSYIRTISANVSSSSEPDVSLAQPVRVVPYPSFCTNEDFKTFMLQIDFNWYMDIGYVYHKDLLKWNLNQLQGIEILLQNPYNGVSFTPEQQEIIANRVKSSNDIEMFIEGRQLDSLIQIDTFYPPANSHYTAGLLPDENWIIVVPNNEVGGRTYFGYLNDTVLSGTINRVRIDLMPSVVSLTNPVMTHEFGHGFIAAGPNFNGHSSILLNPLTIMTATNLKVPPPGVADEKAGRLIYEDTYKPTEELDDILGTSFY